MDWISVKDRLPDNDDMMLVTAQTKKGVRTVNRAYYSESTQSWHGSGSMAGVTAWMPLPEPYEEVELEDDVREPYRRPLAAASGDKDCYTCRWLQVWEPDYEPLCHATDCDHAMENVMRTEPWRDGDCDKWEEKT